MHEVKPQYEELSKQINMQHATNQCYECMRAAKEISQLGQCINQQIKTNRLYTTVYQPGNHRSVIIETRRSSQPSGSLSNLATPLRETGSSFFKIHSRQIPGSLICSKSQELTQLKHKSEPAFPKTYCQNTTQVPFSNAGFYQSFRDFSQGRAAIPHSHLPAGIVATMCRVVNYHNSWARQQQVELLYASGNPGSTAGRGFNPAGGAPGGCRGAPVPSTYRCETESVLRFIWVAPTPH
ncbi:shikimate O-hydroxycinnamoyltransferase [Dorcoceras hygrometricum]|uniref:Shikimate O-hydroxycinnamoyltransferase n=1 Tax=Dorcoceras hygrometricum TaxID=472368 RepID=A0A2Z7CQ44_9LAMI|nr:shikimate O-hydroxycinnamoyltransferase [Dorcoceras hygrometricum]